MAFCTECGSKLFTDDVRFCTNCGAKIHLQDALCNDKSCSSGLSLFNSLEWKSMLTASGASSLKGIILTRVRRLAEHFGVDAGTLTDEIESYIRTAGVRNVNYYLLDLDDNAIFPKCRSIDDNVRLLKTVSSVCDFKYVFILGNEEIVEVAQWENQAGDNDRYVTSDLPYVTLCTESPWDNSDIDWKSGFRVGRLPTTLNRFGEFKTYLANVNAHFNRQNETLNRSYGLSALVWQDESVCEYSRIASDLVYTSPEITDPAIVKSQLSSCRASLLYFNLHGADETAFWYGQEGSSYPTAVSPDVFVNYKDFFILGVEACYGAKYIGLDTEESILKTALANRCLAFLGASKIAYGRPCPAGTCADIVVGEFIESISKNYSAGDAYIVCMMKLTNVSQLDDTDIKTVAEFSLYGDPAVCMKYPADGAEHIQPEKRNFISKSPLQKHLFSDNRRINIAMPDIRRRTRLALATVSSDIKNRIDEFTAASILPDFGKHPEEYQQKIYRLQNSDIMQKVYSRKKGPVYEIAKVYFNSAGNICKVVVAK